ncbi:MAG: hypothetical protein AAB893_03440, partial [Patescibacteria group bacterium]
DALSRNPSVDGGQVDYGGLPLTVYSYRRKYTSRIYVDPDDMGDESIVPRIILYKSSIPGDCFTTETTTHFASNNGKGDMIHQAIGIKTASESLSFWSRMDLRINFWEIELWAGLQGKRERCNLRLPVHFKPDGSSFSVRDYPLEDGAKVNCIAYPFGSVTCKVQTGLSNFFLHLGSQFIHHYEQVMFNDYATTLTSSAAQAIPIAS